MHWFIISVYTQIRAYLFLAIILSFFQNTLRLIKRLYCLEQKIDLIYQDFFSGNFITLPFERSGKMTSGTSGKGHTFNGFTFFCC